MISSVPLWAVHAVRSTIMLSPENVVVLIVPLLTETVVYPGSLAVLVGWLQPAGTLRTTRPPEKSSRPLVTVRVHLPRPDDATGDRKSTRLNSSHSSISY